MFIAVYILQTEKNIESFPRKTAQGDDIGHNVYPSLPRRAASSSGLYCI